MPDDHNSEPKRKTQRAQPKGIDPKTGKPYEAIKIPVPKRDEIEDLIDRAATTPENED